MAEQAQPKQGWALSSYISSEFAGAWASDIIGSAAVYTGAIDKMDGLTPDTKGVLKACVIVAWLVVSAVQKIHYASGRVALKEKA